MNAIRYQLAKAATSSGANYEEAQAAVSRAEFGHKVGISLKEMRESNYWLRLLKEFFPDNDLLLALVYESNELKLIWGKSLVSARKILEKLLTFTFILLPFVLVSLIYDFNHIRFKRNFGSFDNSSCFLAFDKENKCRYKINH